VRVALIEPGVIATPIFGKGDPTRFADPAYPQGRRLLAIFGRLLPIASSPFEVGDLIADLAVSGDDKLRHPVGCMGPELVAWRQGMSDADWVALGGLPDAEFTAKVKATLGLELKL
jgi:hypothetical protein